MSNPALPVTIRYFAFDTEWPFEMTILRFDRSQVSGERRDRARC